jgi:hypothetical protein
MENDKGSSFFGCKSRQQTSQGPKADLTFVNEIFKKLSKVFSKHQQSDNKLLGE